MEKTKTKAVTIALVLVLTFSTLFVVLPAVSAHDPPWNIASWMYVAVSPDPIGVGQTALVIWWHDKIMPTAVGAYGDRWEATIEITKPDNSQETLGPLTSDPVGGGYIQYTPNQVGTYTFVAKFPGQTLTGEPAPEPGNERGTDYIGDYYMPATSEEVTLTVQQEPILEYPSVPLPQDYWDRPIYAENRDWWSISGNWLGGAAIQNNFNPYSTGPKTAHILWTKPITFGGLAGGEFGSVGYYEGLSYENKFPTPVIIQGRLYYNDYPTLRYPIDTFPKGFLCVDLRTGEELWWSNGSITVGQVYDYESPNAHGTISYLWKIPGRREPPEWYMYDAFNGLEICSMENVPGGTSAVGPTGELLKYEYNADDGWLALWNQSRAVWAYHEPFQANYYWNWRPPFGGTVDALKDGYSWNITAPANLPGGIKWVLDDRIIGASSPLLGSFGGYGVNAYSIWCLSLDPANRGELLWRKDYNEPPVQNATFWFGSVDPEAGIFTMKVKETREWYGYDLDTGDYVWGPTEPHPPLDMYGMYFAAAYGKLLSSGYAGELHCYDITNGNELWTYSTEAGGFESYYGGHYPLSIGCIADRKIYLYSSEHSPSKPAWRGSKLRCIDIETGNELWKIDFWANHPIIADGYLVAHNCYDNQIYCFGKGQTETTVSASPAVIADGSSVLIQGTVMDQSPGAKDTPAISDEDMTEWMGYLYMQQPIPAIDTVPVPEDVRGVPVKLEAFGEDGSHFDIGDVTSDAHGNFKSAWTPPDEGLYTIMATFAGSDSYWRSYASTGLSVGPAPSPGVEPTTEPPTSAPPTTEPPTGEAPLVTTEVAIVAGVAVAAVIAIAAYWAIRRRK